ncbi:MAG: 4'-phosphopantetheinyl transferase superfamily protein [Bacteroidales bacterium]|nr:4'-phosphopantetheinyl transferase superfamily protein [Bacteroidales bacterium]MCD8393652.1 4'-phosphopantetheinyl transferase superfamily protein [Bacteroidales bacterium]
MRLKIEDIDIYIMPGRGRPDLHSPVDASPQQDGNRPAHGSTPSRRSREIALRDILVAEAFGPEAKLVHDEHGAPSIAGFNGHISITHSRDSVALAISPSQRIGIDIEHPRDTQLQRVKERFVSPKDSPILSLLHLWTAKEAVYKAAASPGLSLTDIVVTPQSATIPDGRQFNLCWHNIGDEMLCVVY